MPSPTARAEAAWLREPEPVEETCDWCGHDPCSCDEETDLLMDEIYERDEP